MALTQYRAEDVNIIVNGVLIEGFPRGDFCTVERAGEQATVQDGTHGETQVTFMTVKNGTITITVMSGSEANDTFQSLKDSQDGESPGFFAISVVDKNSEARFAFCEKACIQQDPGHSYGDSRGNPQWVILCPILTMKHSSALAQ